MKSKEAKRKCRRLALAQYGLVTRSQALDAGMTRRAIDWQLERGNWHRVHPQVYVYDGVARSWEQSLLAACLWGGARALASHRSAAALWGLASMESSAIEISTPRSLRSWSVVVHRVTAGDTQKVVTKKRGIPLTGIDQTLFDLGGVIPLHHLEVVLDDALNRRLTTLSSLESTVPSLRAAAGLVQERSGGESSREPDSLQSPKACSRQDFSDYWRQPRFRFRPPSTRSEMAAALWREWTSRIRIFELRSRRTVSSIIRAATHGREISNGVIVSRMRAGWYCM